MWKAVLLDVIYPLFFHYVYTLKSVEIWGERLYSCCYLKIDFSFLPDAGVKTWEVAEEVKWLSIIWRDGSNMRPSQRFIVKSTSYEELLRLSFQFLIFGISEFRWFMHLKNLINPKIVTVTVLLAQFPSFKKNEWSLSTNFSLSIGIFIWHFSNTSYSEAKFPPMYFLWAIFCTESLILNVCWRISSVLIDVCSCQWSLSREPLKLVNLF